MRIVVSTIGLNEPPEFVERWASSAGDADEVVLVDTGSVIGSMNGGGTKGPDFNMVASADGSVACSYLSGSGTWDSTSWLRFDMTWPI